MLKEVLYEDDHLKVLYRVGSTSYTLITFSNYGFDVGRGIFWGEQLCDLQDIEAIGFVAKASNWFPASSTTKAIACVQAKQPRTVVTYGHSQGGYAALKYSRQLDASAVIACAPQYSINPEIVLRELRFSHHYDSNLHDSMEPVSEDIGGRIVLVYDPYDLLDQYHVDLIKSSCDIRNLAEIHVHHVGHDVMEVMKSRPVFNEIISASLSGSSFLPAFIKTREAKKTSSRYEIKLVERLLREEKSQTAVGVLLNIEKRNNGFIEQRDKMKVLMISARAYLGINNSFKAVEQMEQAVHLEPANPNAQTLLGDCLIAANRPQEAIATYKTAISIRPDVLSFQEGLAEAVRRLTREADRSR